VSDIDQFMRDGGAVFGDPDPERYAEIRDRVLQRAPGRGMLAGRVVWRA
jgi:hypothetical protein